jgi:hypothetical protein
MRFVIGKGDRDKSGAEGKGKTAGGIIQDPAQHYQQHGYPIPGYPPGMMPMQPGMAPPGVTSPVMMPMHGTLPPGMMPYMMPPPYYNYAHYGGSPYEYPGGNIDMRGCDYTVDSSISSCSAFMCNSEDGGLVKLFRSTVDSVANSVNRAMGEEVCDPRLCDDGDASPHDDVPSPQDHAELLEKIDMLYKLVAEKQATVETTEETMDLNPLDDLLEASNEVNDDSLGEANVKAKEEYGSVEELTSLFVDNTFSDEHVKVTLCVDTDNLNESVEAEAGFVDPQNILNEFIEAETKSQGPQTMKCRHLKTCHAKDKKRIAQKKPPFQMFKASTRESELSGSGSSGSEVVCDVSSPVSVIASLETPSCAYCGLRGGDGKDAKKLKLCSACQSTYYCSSKCQMKDWTGGHSVTCQVIP